MIEKLSAALQSIDLTQIIIAVAGGLGGAALWAQKRYKWFAQWRAKRLKRRSAVRELPERVAGFALTMSALEEQSRKTLQVLEAQDRTLADQSRVLSTISAMVHGEMELDPTPRFICGNDGENLNVNTAYARLVGCGRDELLGFGYQRFLPSSLNPDYMQTFAQASAKHRSFESALLIRRPDGKLVEAQVRIVPHPEHDPPAHYWVGVITSAKVRP